MRKCKFIVKNSSFEVLVVFLPIFVAVTKITFVYNFVAPLEIMFNNGAQFENFFFSLLKWEISGFFNRSGVK